MTEIYHNPVLREESVALLNVVRDGVYVDATFGGGGHSALILEKLEGGMLIAFDKDPAAHENRINDPRLILVGKDYRNIEQVLKEMNIKSVNGILADLGISSRQVDDAARGFSFRFDAPLDMRMDPTSALTAADLVNRSSELELKTLLRQFGEVQKAGRVAAAIVHARTLAPILTTGRLESVLAPFAPAADRRKFLAQVFQALRIVVNSELESLDIFLTDSLQVLAPGGRMVVIAYHSLEDRRVKNFFKTGTLEGELQKDFFGNPITPWKQVTRKAIIPSDEEIKANPRARSAKLRAAEKWLTPPPSKIQSPESV